MRTFWVPKRGRGFEFLDDPATPDDDRRAAMSDLVRSNRLFQGTHAVRSALRAAWPTLPPDATLIDVGTGMGDIPRELVTEGAAHGVQLRTIGVDSVPYQALLADSRLSHAVAGDALALPFADNSADVVTCSQVLHHFFDSDLRRLIGELHRVSRDWVVISDLRRSFLAAAGFGLVTRFLGFHVLTVLDGATSVKRGFLPDELDQLVLDATGVRPTVRSSRFWRLTATWRKSSVR